MDIFVLVLVAVAFVGIVFFLGSRAQKDFSGNAVVTKDSKIIDILALDDGIGEVLEQQGLSCTGCPSAAGETLDQACTVHNLSTERLIVILNEYMKDKSYYFKVSENGCPDDAMQIRKTVFVEEQKFEDEFDEIDDIATHYVLYDAENNPVGCARSYRDGESKTYHIGRMAVLKQFRGLHLGKKIMQYAEEDLKKKGAKYITLSAQKRASGFYKSLGYEPYGEAYLDQHCPHISMKKRL